MEDSLKLKISHLFNSMRCFRAAYLQQPPSPPAPLTRPTNPRSASHKTPVLPSRIAEAFPSRRKCICPASSIAAHGNLEQSAGLPYLFRGVWRAWIGVRSSLLVRRAALEPFTVRSERESFAAVLCCAVLCCAVLCCGVRGLVYMIAYAMENGGIAGSGSLYAGYGGFVEMCDGLRPLCGVRWRDGFPRPRCEAQLTADGALYRA
jgi:hypothetical protein